MIYSYCVLPHCFRTLLYYLDLLYTNMCPIEIPAKGQLREVKIYLCRFKLFFCMFLQLCIVIFLVCFNLYFLKFWSNCNWNNKLGELYQISCLWMGFLVRSQYDVIIHQKYILLVFCFCSLCMICVFCRSILGMNPKLCKSQLKASLLTLLFNFFVFSLLYLLYDIVSCISKWDAHSWCCVCNCYRVIRVEVIFHFLSNAWKMNLSTWVF